MNLFSQLFSLKNLKLKKKNVTTTSVKLTWTKVSNADGYIIYKYDDNKKTWVRINKTTTNGTSYTVSKLTSGTKYKFAIKTQVIIIMLKLLIILKMKSNVKL